MKKLWFLLLCCMLFMTCGILSVSAQDLSEDVVRAVTENLDNFFPITTLWEKFDRKAPSIFGNLGTETATETNTNDTRNMLLFVNPDGLSTYVFWEKVNSRNSKNFCFSMDVTVNDIYPPQESGCFIGFINDAPSSSAEKEPLQTTMIVISDAIYMETQTEDGSLTDRNKLADRQGPQVNLMIVRLTGETLFYVDGEMVGQYHDGKSGPFSLRYGTVAYSHGEAAECSFDNLSVREVMK